MKNGFRIGLRAGEKIYINGAVLRADRKVSLEFLNDVAFLLESHIILAEETTTPLRQLYFVLQTMLMDPTRAPATKEIFDRSHALLLASFRNEEILSGLTALEDLVSAGRIFDALKTIRALLPLESAILGNEQFDAKPALEVA